MLPDILLRAGRPLTAEDDLTPVSGALRLRSPALQAAEGSWGVGTCSGKWVAGIRAGDPRARPWGGRDIGGSGRTRVGLLESDFPAQSLFLTCKLKMEWLLSSPILGVKQDTTYSLYLLTHPSHLSTWPVPAHPS